MRWAELGSVADRKPFPRTSYTFFSSFFVVVSLLLLLLLLLPFPPMHCRTENFFLLLRDTSSIFPQNDQFHNGPSVFLLFYGVPMMAAFPDFDWRRFRSRYLLASSFWFDIFNPYCLWRPSSFHFPKKKFVMFYWVFPCTRFHETFSGHPQKIKKAKKKQTKKEKAFHSRLRCRFGVLICAVPMLRFPLDFFYRVSFTGFFSTVNTDKRERERERENRMAVRSHGGSHLTKLLHQITLRPLFFCFYSELLFILFSYFHFF